MALQQVVKILSMTIMRKTRQNWLESSSFRTIVRIITH